MGPYDWNVDDEAWAPKDEPWTSTETYLVAERGWMLHRQGSLPEAAVLFRGLTVIDEGNAYAWKGLALALDGMRRHAEARQCWDRVEAAGSPIDAWAGRCRCAIALGQFDDAARDLARLESSGDFRAAAPAAELRIRFQAATAGGRPR
ncbi:MAG: hypothetical protein R2729_28045 [Bryobacteraceae bacterium]